MLWSASVLGQKSLSAESLSARAAAPWFGAVRPESVQFEKLGEITPCEEEARGVDAGANLLALLHEEKSERLPYSLWVFSMQF